MCDISEINECKSQPCLNGATCVESNGTTNAYAPLGTDNESFYTCVCPPGYTGKNCEKGGKNGYLVKL